MLCTRLLIRPKLTIYLKLETWATLRDRQNQELAEVQSKYLEKGHEFVDLYLDYCSGDLLGWIHYLILCSHGKIQLYLIVTRPRVVTIVGLLAICTC